MSKRLHLSTARISISSYSHLEIPRSGEELPRFSNTRDVFPRSYEAVKLHRYLSRSRHRAFSVFSREKKKSAATESCTIDDS